LFNKSEGSSLKLIHHLNILNKSDFR
jgi:hypothetical protein